MTESAPSPARPLLRLVFSTSLVLAVASACPAGDPAYPALGPGLSLLERQYLFDEELSPPRLFEEAGKVYSRDVADLVIRRLDERAWLYETPDCELRVEVAADATVRSLEGPLATVGRFLRACSNHLPEKMPAMDSFLLSGVLAGLDPYSVVFDERRQTEHTIQYQGKLAGIGARIGQRRNQLTLIEVYPDSPAARADLRDNDQVLRIDNLSTKNILATDAVQKIRGKEGTTVTLLVRREGEEDPRSVVVTRGIVVIPSVKSRLLNADILYTEITQFSQTTPDDFRRHLLRAVEDKHLRGVIIDLRRNSGGSMMGASAIGDLFLREGLLITTAGRDGQAARGLTPEVRASGAALAPDLPVVFLTSPVTASGSELLAASLRNNDRAVLLGEHTFGKGCIQKTFPLHDASTMKMTVGHFLPNGRPIPGGGLTPDIEVSTWRVGTGRLAIPLPAPESKMPFWLRTPKWSDASSSPPRWRIAFGEEFAEDDPSLAEYDEEGVPPEEPDDPDKPDRAIEIAAALLRNHGDASASRMLEDAADFLARTVQASEADIADFMYAHGLDWTDGPRPMTKAALSVSVVPLAPLRAGVESQVEVRLTNNSPAPYYRLRGLLDSTSSAFHGKSVAFGRIEPGSTRAWRMKVKPSGTARTGRAKVEAILFDDEGEVARAPAAHVVVEEAPRPHLAIQAAVTAAQDDPSVLRIGIELENRGVGPAEKLVVRVQHSVEEHFEILEGTGDADSLAPGEKTSFELAVRLLGSYDEPPEAVVQISERAHGLLLERPMPLVPTVAHPSARTWNEPPRITIEGFSSTGDDGTYEVVVSATDDRELSRVRARLDDTTVAYVEPSTLGTDRRQTRLRIPWKPGDEVKRLRIEAVDSEGLKEFWAGTL